MGENILKKIRLYSGEKEGLEKVLNEAKNFGIEKISLIEAAAFRSKIYSVDVIKEYPILNSYDLKKPMAAATMSSLNKINSIMKKFDKDVYIDNVTASTSTVRTFLTTTDHITTQINSMTGKESSFFSAVKDYDELTTFEKKVVKKSM